MYGTVHKIMDCTRSMTKSSEINMIYYYITHFIWTKYTLICETCRFAIKLWLKQLSLDLYGMALQSHMI